MSAGAQLFTSPADLMRAIGSKEGFDPMPPSQHRFLMDQSEPPLNRIMGLLFASTIHPGKGRKRSTYARDSHGRAMKQKDFCAVLGISDRNMTTYFKQLSEDDRLRVDEKDGRIYLGGNAREPQLARGEEGVEEEGLLCTKEFPAYITQFLQQLSEKECRQATAALSERVRLHKQWEADAIAQVRMKEYEDVANLLKPYGFEDGGGTGRPRVKREQFSVQITLADSYVQKSLNDSNGASVHKSETSFVQGESSSAQNAHPYYFSETDNLQSEVEPPPVENSASGLEKEAPAARPDSSPTPPTAPLETPAQEQVDPLPDPDPVIATLEYQFQRKLAPKDPLRTKFPDLAQRFAIPKASICRWMAEKLEKKERQRYKIFSPGALYEFAVKDLAGWIETHRREIEADFEYERREKLARNEEAFDPADYNGQLRSLAAKKGLS